MTNPNESSSSSSKSSKKSTPPPPPPPAFPPHPHPQRQNPTAPAHHPRSASLPPPPPPPPAPKRREAGGSSSAVVAVGGGMEVGGGSSTGAVGFPPQQVGPAEVAPQLPHICCVCNKSFGSRKALYGHMRSHPERTWRGVNPPRPSLGPRPRLGQPAPLGGFVVGKVSYGAGASGGQPQVGQDIDLNQPQVEISPAGEETEAKESGIDLNKPAAKEDSE